MFVFPLLIGQFVSVPSSNPLCVHLASRCLCPGEVLLLSVSSRAVIDVLTCESAGCESAAVHLADSKYQEPEEIRAAPACLPFLHT